MLHRLAGLGRITALTIALMALMPTACSDGPITAPSPPPPPPVPLAIAPANALVAVGGTMQFLVRPDSRAAEVVWSTSDPTVAEVSPTGFLTARRIGLARIKVRAGSDSAVAQVLVSAAKCLFGCR